MAFEFNDLKGLLFLVLFIIPLTTSTNINCYEKSFHCVNSTHFMICVGLGGKVFTTIDDTIIQCPPTTICHKSNRFECEFPKIEEPTTPLYVISISTTDTNVLSSINENVTTPQTKVTTGVPLPAKTETSLPIEEETSPTKIELLESLRKEFTGGNERVFDDIATSTVSTFQKEVAKTNSMEIINISDSNLSAHPITETVTYNISELILTNNSKSIETTTSTDGLLTNNTQLVRSEPVLSEKPLEDVMITTFSPNIIQQNFELDKPPDNISSSKTDNLKINENKITTPEVVLDRVQVSISTTEKNSIATTNDISSGIVVGSPQITILTENNTITNDNIELKSEIPVKANEFKEVHHNQSEIKEQQTTTQPTAASTQVLNTTESNLTTLSSVLHSDTVNEKPISLVTVTASTPLEYQKTNFNIVSRNPITNHVTAADLLVNFTEINVPVNSSNVQQDNVTKVVNKSLTNSVSTIINGIDFDVTGNPGTKTNVGIETSQYDTKINRRMGEINQNPLSSNLSLPMIENDAQIIMQNTTNYNETESKSKIRLSNISPDPIMNKIYDQYKGANTSVKVEMINKNVSDIEPTTPRNFDITATTLKLKQMDIDDIFYTTTSSVVTDVTLIEDKNSLSSLSESRATIVSQVESTTVLYLSENNTRQHVQIFEEATSTKKNSLKEKYTGGNEYYSDIPKSTTSIPISKQKPFPKVDNAENYPSNKISETTSSAATIDIVEDSTMAMVLPGSDTTKFELKIEEVTTKAPINTEIIASAKNTTIKSKDLKKYESNYEVVTIEIPITVEVIATTTITNIDSANIEPSNEQITTILPIYSEVIGSNKATTTLSKYFTKYETNNEEVKTKIPINSVITNAKTTTISSIDYNYKKYEPNNGEITNKVPINAEVIASTKATTATSIDFSTNESNNEVVSTKVPINSETHHITSVKATTTSSINFREYEPNLQQITTKVPKNSEMVTSTKAKTTSSIETPTTKLPTLSNVIATPMITKTPSTDSTKLELNYEEVTTKVPIYSTIGENINVKTHITESAKITPQLVVITNNTNINILEETTTQNQSPYVVAEKHMFTLEQDTIMTTKLGYKENNDIITTGPSYTNDIITNNAIIYTTIQPKSSETEKSVKNDLMTTERTYVGEIKQTKIPFSPAATSNKQINKIAVDNTEIVNFKVTETDSSFLATTVRPNKENELKIQNIINSTVSTVSPIYLKPSSKITHSFDSVTNNSNAVQVTEAGNIERRANYDLTTSATLLHDKALITDPKTNVTLLTDELRNVNETNVTKDSFSRFENKTDFQNVTFHFIKSIHGIEKSIKHENSSSTLRPSTHIPLINQQTTESKIVMVPIIKPSTESLLPFTSDNDSKVVTVEAVTIKEANDKKTKDDYLIPSPIINKKIIDSSISYTLTTTEANVNNGQVISDSTLKYATDIPILPGIDTLHTPQNFVTQPMFDRNIETLPKIVPVTSDRTENVSDIPTFFSEEPIDSSKSIQQTPIARISTTQQRLTTQINVDIGIDKNSKSLSEQNKYESTTPYSEVTNILLNNNKKYKNITEIPSLLRTGDTNFNHTMESKTRDVLESTKITNGLNDTNHVYRLVNISTNLYDIDNEYTNSNNSGKSEISKTNMEGDLQRNVTQTGNQNIYTSNVKRHIDNSRIYETSALTTAGPTHQTVKGQTTTTTRFVFDCINGTRGKYADSKDCRKFYICLGKLQPIVGTCPNNTVFSEINKQCTRNLSHCIRNNQFHCMYEGRFSDFFKDNIYYICVKHRLHGFFRYKLQCQNGYILDKAAVKCMKNEEIPSQSVSSISENSQVNNEQNEVSVKSEEGGKQDNDFECKKEGKFPYKADCRKYYECSKNKKDEYRRKIKTCSDDKVFDKEHKKCESSESNEC